MRAAVRRISGCLLSGICMMILCCAMSAQVHANTADGNTLMQFTSEGHVLGFGHSQVYVASSDHVLKVAFVGGRSVAPVSLEGAEKDGAFPDAKDRPFSVSFPEVWAGVGVVYEKGSGSIVKSTYTVSAGASERAVEQIRLSYNRPVHTDENGNLVIGYPTGSIVEEAPVAWQEIDGARNPVRVAFTCLSENEVGFTVGDYDSRYALVIDPNLTWNTFLGGSGIDRGYGITMDSDGNVYVVGYSTATWGTNPLRAFTTTNPATSDAFAAKLNSSGTLQWHTFLGGSGNDRGYGITMDSDGNVYVVGYSTATWGTNPLRNYTDNTDAFAAKLDSDGAYTWHTFLGGSDDDRGRSVTSVTVNAIVTVYITGYSWDTWSGGTGDTQPVRDYTAGSDAFVAKLGSDGAYTWHTFLGGEGDDYGYGITTDSVGNAYMVGYSTATWGTNPLRNYTDNTDAFAAKLDSSGTLQWHTFLGGAGDDRGFGITTDSVGNAYVVGYSTATWGTNPLRPYSDNGDAFAAKLNSSGTLQWHTFLGGDDEDSGSIVTVDSSNNVYVVGYSYATWGTPLRNYTDNTDAFAAKLNSSGALQWNAFLGGSEFDYGNGVTVDSSNNVYVLGYSGATWGTNPLRAFSGNDDAFVAKIPATPTLVKLASLQAASADNHIRVTWQTASELDNAGFHLWRTDSPEHDYTRITAAMIPAKGGILGGADYAVDDIDTISGRSYYYKLEDIDTRGNSTFHGPASAWCGLVNIQANGSDGPVTVAAGQPVAVSVAVQPGDNAGALMDWWILADTPFGWYSYGPQGWISGMESLVTAPLADVTETRILDVTLPPGDYIFYEAVEDPANGSVGCDSVSVKVER